jgi:Rhodopirellula transposase DDE domain
MHDDPELHRKFASILPSLDERQRRLLAAAEARSLGYGGVRRVSRASGISHTAIQRALKQLDAPPLPAGHVRRPGGGRKKVRDKSPAILAALEELIAPETRGDPMSPLRWTCKSTRQLAEALAGRGFGVSHRVVGELLHHLGYSLQANAKTREGKQSPDRDAQFRYISKVSGRYLAAGWPVISVDTKKKELVGDFKNGGREWQPKGQPEEVQVHDFPDPRVGKAIPYGVYDLGWDLGWVNVGVDHDTASFAVEGIRQWWAGMGEETDPEAGQLLICADGGGSNGYRVRLWKVELQAFADESGLEITVCHFPPGTSKWNKIEHRLFSHITMNWRGRPLVSLKWTPKSRPLNPIS